jgi:hypothetical protein
MLEKNKVYSKEEWLKDTQDMLVGIQKDVLKERYAPDIDYADFFMAMSKSGRFVYCAKMVESDSSLDKFLGKRKIKVLGILTSQEYGLV